MSAGSVNAKTKMVALFVVATLVSGSLAVALPLNSPDNNAEPKLRMFSDAFGSTQLTKKNGASLVQTGEIVYLQLTGLSDNNIMASGTAQNGELEVLIHYAHEGKNYDIIFKQVAVQNGDSEIFPWTVGDFSADGIFNPNDPRDEAIACDTTGVVMYGKVSSTGFRDLLTAANSDADFVGYCGTSSSNNSNNNASNFVFPTGDTNSNYSTTHSTDHSQTYGQDVNEYCASESINGNIKIEDEQTYVQFKSCYINGNLKIEDSHVGLIDSTNNGNVKLKESDLIIEGGQVKGNIDVKKGSLYVEGTEIFGNVEIEDGSIYLGDGAVIHGNLKCKDSQYDIYDTYVRGKVKGCELNGSSSSSGSNNNNDDDDDNGNGNLGGDCTCEKLQSLTLVYHGPDATISGNDVNISPSTVTDGTIITVTPTGSKFKSNTEFTITTNSGTKKIVIHTSCSKPLAPGDIHADTDKEVDSIPADGIYLQIVTLTAEKLTGKDCPPQEGTIIIVKDAIPDDPQDFQFTSNAFISNFVLDDDNDPTLSNQQILPVAPGTYAVGEVNIPQGWTLVSATCSDGSQVSAINVSAGETVICKFVNKKELPPPPPPEKGTIKIIKDTIPDDPQDFSFTTTGGLTPSTFTLDDDSDGTLSNTQLYSNVVPGSYTVTENSVANFTLINIICIDPDNGTTVNLSQRKANIDLDAGEVVVCVFKNEKELPPPPPPQKGTIIIIKDTVPDDPQDFTFTGTLGTFNLDDDSDGLLSNTKTFSNIPAGTYTVSEIAVSGFTLTSITCVDPDNGSSTDLAQRKATIDLDGGEIIVCTFTNTKDQAPPPTEFKLTVVKLLKQLDGTLTAIENAQVIVTDKATGQQVASGTTAANGSFMTTLPKGTYIVKVTPPNAPNGCVFVPTTDTAEVFLFADKTVQFVNKLLCPKPAPAKIIVHKLQDLGTVGVIEPGVDQPLPGVKIALLDSLGKQIVSGVTDVNGIVVFDVFAGQFTQFKVIEPSQLISGSCQVVSTTPALPHTITVSAGQTIEVEILNELDCPKFNLTVIKFNDENGNGMFDQIGVPGETLFKGFTIKVFDVFGNPVAQAVTNDQQAIVFTLLPGKYTVKEIFPTPPDGCSFIQTTPGSINNFQHVINLQQDMTIKFGNKVKCLPATQPPATVQVFKIRDFNENDHIDCGAVFCENVAESVRVPSPEGAITEPGLEGFTIQAFDASGKLVASKVTDLAGHAVFSLTPGTYTFKEVNGPLPSTCTPDPVTQKPRIPIKWTQIFPVTPGQTISVVADDHRILLFGNKLVCEPLSTVKVEKLVEGAVGDGLIAQHPVTIQVLDQTGVKIITSAQTQIEEGNRAFATFLLRPASYVIREVLPTTVPDNCIDGRWELINVQPQPQPSFAKPGDIHITLSPGEDKLDQIKFNNRLVCPPNIGKLTVTKFQDKDGDGVRDMVPFVDPGVKGFLIKVYHPNDLTTPIAKALTDSNGVVMFLLETLPPGQQYVIREDTFGPIPPDCASGKWIQTFPGAANNFEHKITIVGQQEIKIEFGNKLSCFVAPAKLVVHKFHDDNQDGIENNSESGLSGFKIKIFNSQGTPALDASGLPLEGITDSSGTVTFILQPGQYIVYEFFRVVQPGECDGGKWIQTAPGPASAQPDPKVASMAPNPIAFTILEGEIKDIKFGNFLGPCFDP